MASCFFGHVVAKEVTLIRSFFSSFLYFSFPGSLETKVHATMRWSEEFHCLPMPCHPLPFHSSEDLEYWFSRSLDEPPAQISRLREKRVKRAKRFRLTCSQNIRGGGKTSPYTNPWEVDIPEKNSHAV